MDAVIFKGASKIDPKAGSAAKNFGSNGIRTKKTKPDGSYTCYEMVAGKAVGETRYNAAGNVSLYMRYTFDESGNVVGISLWYPGDTVWTDYYFAKNLQGDVLAVYAASDNTCVAAYTYDSWGNILTQYGSLANTNPFRYRGYYYDNESWFYYLQSRYYDPAIGRFINADSYASTGQGILGNNMFTYCLSNPLNYLDKDGEDAIWIHEDDSAGTFGHSGLLVQDKYGNWWYFYWGPSNRNANLVELCLGTPEICVFVKLNTEGYDMRNIDDVRKVIANHTGERVGEQADDITHIIYYDGNFIPTFNYLTDYKESAENSSDINYNLLLNNCVQVSTKAMGRSHGYFQTFLPLVPDNTYRKLSVQRGFEILCDALN